MRKNPSQNGAESGYLLTARQRYTAETEEKQIKTGRQKQAQTCNRRCYTEHI